MINLSEINLFLINLPKINWKKNKEKEVSTKFKNQKGNPFFNIYLININKY